MARGLPRRYGRSTTMRSHARARGPASSSGTPRFRRCPCSSRKPVMPERSWIRPSPESVMPLREVQTTFVGAMLGGDAAPAAEYVAVDGLLPEARLQIYRHHVVSSLTAALQA